MMNINADLLQRFINLLIRKISAVRGIKVIGGVAKS